MPYLSRGAQPTANDVVLRELVAEVLQHDLDAIARVAEDQRRHASANQITREPNRGLDVALPNTELGVDDGRIVDEQLARTGRRAALIDELDGPPADSGRVRLGIPDGRGSKNESRRGAVETRDARQPPHDVR